MAERCSGILAGKTPGFGSGNPGDPVQGPAEIFHPYASGGYYPETFAFRNQASEKGTGGVGSITNIGPLFCGGDRSWDRIGMKLRFSSSPGTPPDFYFVVYEMDDVTLFPTSLLYQSASANTQGVATAWVEDTITLSTTANWIGVGWHVVGTGEAYGIGCGGDAFGAGNYQGYTPYGHTRVSITLTPRLSLYATQADGTATAAATSLFSTTPIATVTNSHLNTGVYMRIT